MALEEAFSLKCARESLRTWGGVLSLFIGLSVGLVAWNWIGSVLAKFQPVVTTLESAQIVTTPGDVPSQDLRIVLRSPVIKDCVRISQQLLYRTVPDGNGSVHRLYFPLGSGLNGAGFGVQSPNPWVAPGMGIPGGDFIVTVSLPARLEPGQYWLIQRSLYECWWLGGLRSWKIPYETPPMSVVVP